MAPENLLQAPTPRAWLEQAPQQLGVLLVDHANCEKKAASTALALMFAYAEDWPLTKALSRLAREELRHYEQVCAIMQTLRIEPMRLSPARYAQAMRQAVAHAEPLRQIDLLICGALIEARSCERFAALAGVMHSPARELFASLHAAEARHRGLYLDHARRAAERAGLVLHTRVLRLAQLEAELVCSPDRQFRFHSGVPAEG